MKKRLNISFLKKEAHDFALKESKHHEQSLFGVTDGKAIGTYLEHKFQNSLKNKYVYKWGSSAKGIDFPELGVDIKVTSIRQPQSSCPYKSAKQKIYGLGYSLLVFVYDKMDDEKTRTGNLNVIHTIYVESSRTGDFQTTTALRRIIDNSGNIDDIIAILSEHHLPVDDIQAKELADEILQNPPEIGYLTISNALQWRLQYSRVIEKAGEITGIIRVV